MKGKALVIGMGSIGQRHLKNLASLFPDTVLGVLSSSGRSIEYAPHNAVIFSDMNAAIDWQPSFAIIASPASHHLEHGKAMLGAGIPVLIEKPLCADPAMGRLLMEALPIGSRAAVAYCLRYLPAARAVQSVLLSGELGRLLNVQVYAGQYLPDWRKGVDYRVTVSAREELGGGVLWELSHELDYLQWFLGPLTCCWAGARHSEQLAIPVEASVDMLLTTSEDTACHVHLNFLQQVPTRRCVIYGERATLVWDLVHNCLCLQGHDGDRVLLDGPHDQADTMYKAMLRDFVRYVEGQQHQCTSLNDALLTVELIKTIKDSMHWLKPAP